MSAFTLEEEEEEEEEEGLLEGVVVVVVVGLHGEELGGCCFMVS